MAVVVLIAVSELCAGGCGALLHEVRVVAITITQATEYKYLLKHIELAFSHYFTKAGKGITS